MTYVVVVAVVVAVFLALTGRSKKRVVAKMRNLANAGRIVAAEKLKEKLVRENGKHQFGANEHTITLHAAAGINYIFGEDVNERHRNLDLDALQNYVDDWVNSDLKVLELLVQSIRALLTVNYLASGNLSSKGAEFLELYGAKFPDAPNPENFGTLVNRELGDLPEEQQVSIRKTFHIAR